MGVDLIRLDLRLRWRMVLFTGLGTALYTWLIVSMFPTFKDDPSVDEMLAANPAAAAAFGINGSITSPPGWLSANLYANFGPLMALLLTIGYGAAAIAGQNAAGYLGTITALPLGRGRIAAEKVVTLVLVALVVPLAALIGVLPGPFYYDLDPGWANLAATTAAFTLLGLGFGAIAMWVGALTGSRGAALGVAAGLAAAAYLISSLAPLVSWIHRVRWASPFYWAVGHNQLADGLGWPSAGLLVAFCLIPLIGVFLAFARLDLD